MQQNTTKRLHQLHSQTLQNLHSHIWLFGQDSTQNNVIPQKTHYRGVCMECRFPMS
jgi:hypothetical protein